MNRAAWTTIRVWLATIGGLASTFLGGLDGLLWTLIAFSAVDCVTGILCAIAEKKLSSEVGFKGFARKVLIFLLVGIAHILDQNVLGTGTVLRSAVIIFYISNEGVSLLENAARLGLPVPTQFKSVLAQLHKKSEETSVNIPDVTESSTETAENEKEEADNEERD